MKDIFLLLHVYEYGKEKEHEAVKTLGIYTSLSKAEEALERYYKLPGFCEYPKECFKIEEYFYNKDMWWNEGFASWDEASGILDND